MLKAEILKTEIGEPEAPRRFAAASRDSGETSTH